MDSALKQRLLGAAVLIALAIIFVPMMLSNAPQKQDTTTENLAIPAPPERKFEIRTLPVESPSAPTPSSTSATAPDPNKPDPNKPDPNKIVTVDTHAPARPDARPEDNTAPPAAAPATTKPETKPASAPDTKPAVAEPKPVLVAPEAKPAATASGRFAVNLGVYADQAHADALVTKLKVLRQPAYSEPTEYQGKPALRVRVGPFADRAAAEGARLKIKQSEPKVPSSVVESSEQPKVDAPANAFPPNRAGGWAVQVGAFKSEGEANKLRERLRGGGIAAFTDRNGSGDTALWRVRTGPYTERSAADGARATLKSKFQLDGNIVTQP
jgi:DedD protein